jgi:NAD(P)-dependent dehydrogenase (short-subunit alcohol dehydrogenase family)
MTRVAVVTGGASGIGLSLVRSLAARGDTVVIADVDEEAIAAATADLSASGGKVDGARLDVRDASEFRQLAQRVVKTHGRIDLLFNHAGVGIGGDAESLTMAHWDRAIDVNLRGVVNGVMAVYPLMLQQKSGHIINTASLSGITPAPLFTPYAMTKHAIVGLSRSLRAEAAEFGVKVSVLCPGTTDTAFLRRGTPSDLPRSRAEAQLDSGAPQRWQLATKAAAFYSPDALAQDVLRAIDGNKAIIVAPGRARLYWRIYRFAPWLLNGVSAAVTGKVIQSLDKADSR